MLKSHKHYETCFSHTFLHVKLLLDKVLFLYTNIGGLGLIQTMFFYSTQFVYFERIFKMTQADIFLVAIWRLAISLSAKPKFKSQM